MMKLFCLLAHHYFIILTIKYEMIIISTYYWNKKSSLASALAFSMCDFLIS